jgi:hypothetical protein
MLKLSELITRIAKKMSRQRDDVLTVCIGGDSDLTMNEFDEYYKPLLAFILSKYRNNVHFIMPYEGLTTSFSCDFLISHDFSDITLYKVQTAPLSSYMRDRNHQHDVERDILSDDESDIFSDTSSSLGYFDSDEIDSSLGVKIIGSFTTYSSRDTSLIDDSCMDIVFYRQKSGVLSNSFKCVVTRRYGKMFSDDLSSFIKLHYDSLIGGAESVLSWYSSHKDVSQCDLISLYHSHCFQFVEPN